MWSIHSVKFDTTIPTMFESPNSVLEWKSYSQKKFKEKYMLVDDIIETDQSQSASWNF